MGSISNHFSSSLRNGLNNTALGKIFPQSYYPCLNPTFGFLAEIVMSPSSEKDPFDFEIPPASNHVIKNENGVFKVYQKKVSSWNVGWTIIHKERKKERDAQTHRDRQTGTDTHSHARAHTHTVSTRGIQLSNPLARSFHNSSSQGVAVEGAASGEAEAENLVLIDLQYADLDEFTHDHNLLCSLIVDGPL